MCVGANSKDYSVEKGKSMTTHAATIVSRPYGITIVIGFRTWIEISMRH